MPTNSDGTEKVTTLDNCLTRTYGPTIVKQVDEVELIEIVQNPQSQVPVVIGITKKKTVVIQIIAEVPLKAVYWAAGISGAALAALMRFRPELLQKVVESISGGSS